jgi:sulfate transport system ATP-binding protein
MAKPAAASPRAASPRAQALRIEGVSKRFGQFPALNDVSLTAEAGEFLALLGPSGSGKTTLLRVLAGLERPDAGDVRFGDEDFLALRPRRRRVGMVFQHYALFRHMTVGQNIAFGMTVLDRSERPGRDEICRRVGELLTLVQLEGLETRYPAQLSGGQRQRVALARALAIGPRMLLLDEPFGALDAQVRRELRRWLRQVHERTGVSTVFVTHDQEEALDMADRVAILHEGRIVQIGAPQNLYQKPKNPFVFEFLGPACRLPGAVRDGVARVADWSFRAPEGAADGRAEVLFRPDETDFTEGAGLHAEVRDVSRRGATFRIDCRVAGQEMELLAHEPNIPAGLAPGACLRFTPRRPSLFQD